MPCLHELGNLTIDVAAGIDEIDRIELVPARVALITTGPGRTTYGTSPLDVAVGQRPAGGRRDRALRGLFDHVAVLVQTQEDLLAHPMMVGGRGAGEEVVGEAEAHEGFDDHP